MKQMERLEELWYDEGCHITVRYERVDEWCVLLGWFNEWNNPHEADWVEYTWQFYGDTIAEAADEAVRWCEALLPFKCCEECDGNGYVAAPDARSPHRVVACSHCRGSGLHNYPTEENK